MTEHEPNGSLEGHSLPGDETGLEAADDDSPGPITEPGVGGGRASDDPSGEPTGERPATAGLKGEGNDERP
jgi:hypothetical protein